MEKRTLIQDIVGNTPLLYLPSLSKKTGCHIYAKAEYLNPGGSVKDRTALGIIKDAEARGVLKTGMTIVEGTAGNTGIGIATMAAQRGYRCLMVLPNNQSTEKYQTLEALNVEVKKVPPCPFADQNHFYHQARRISESDPQKYFWANQFENIANFQIHYETTGPEIWQQLSHKVDVFCAAVGTGGTLAGVSKYLKEKNPKSEIVLLDPMGSGLFEYINNGQIKSSGSSVTEGIGIMRLTENFKQAKVDKALQIDDQKMITMLYYLAKHEGLLIGTSAALNVYGAYQLALRYQNSGKNIVTILCDSALRYQSKVFNSEWLSEKKLTPAENLD
ncbi:MAG: cysteine synthase A [Bdellovibrionaceae bacterium]|nr:cysteine synthase A [Pseudobdellovibrionaceae bacterium]